MTIDFSSMKKILWNPLEKTGSGGITKDVLYGLHAPFHKKNPVIFTVDTDLFDESVSDEWIDQVFAAMALLEKHTFLVATKNTERMCRYMKTPDRDDRIGYTAMPKIDPKACGLLDWPIRNIWLGATVENQETADEIVFHLMRTPAEIRWVNANPLTGPIRFQEIPTGVNGPLWPYTDTSGDIPKLDWVFVQGDMHSDDHPLHPDWVVSIYSECQEAHVPFYFAGWGQWVPLNQMSFEMEYSIYKPKRKATKGENQFDMDEMYGRVCTVEERLINYQGDFIQVTDESFNQDKLRCHSVFKLGNNRSGCTLHQNTYQAWPDQ